MNRIALRNLLALSRHIRESQKGKIWPVIYTGK